MHVQLNVYSAPKEGYRPGEWEDGGAGGAGGGRGADPAICRFAVADGATETYDSMSWVRQLIGSFLTWKQPSGARWPKLERESMTSWFTAMQEQWMDTAPAGTDFIEQAKIRQGTLATFVGCQVIGLDTRAPAWRAVALGDSVLFHVRDGQLLDQFPRLRSTDFASAPEGISTLPQQLGRMSEHLQFREGRLAAGDLIFAATDAFAQWMTARAEEGDPGLWELLGGLVHDSAFERLIAGERRSRAMKDDDVTLLRIRLLTQPATKVMVCQ